MFLVQNENKFGANKTNKSGACQNLLSLIAILFSKFDIIETLWKALELKLEAVHKRKLS